MTAAFSATPNPTTCGQAVDFDASASSAMPGRTITSYAWDFGDGATASGVQVSHTYATLGVYTATLTVTDDAMPPHSATTSQQVFLDSSLPVADAGGPYVIERGDSLTLDASGTTDIDIPCGDTLTYEWALGGDNDVDAHGVSPTVSSAALEALGLTGGTYTILMRARDSIDLLHVASAELTINIPNHPPVANADTVTVRQTNSVDVAVLANDSDPDGDPIHVVNSTQPAHGLLDSFSVDTFNYEPNVGYLGPDSFTYTIEDSHGASATATVNITVTPGLGSVRANVLYEDSGLVLGEQACFELLDSEGVRVGSVQCLGPASQTAIFSNVPLGDYSAAVAYTQTIPPNPPSPRLPTRYAVPVPIAVHVAGDGLTEIVTFNIELAEGTLSVLGVPQKYGDACAELREPGAVPDLWGEIPTVATSCDNDPATGFALGPVVARSYELFITDLPLWYAPVVVPVTLAAGANSVTVSVPDQAGMAVRLSHGVFHDPGACWQITDDLGGHGDIDMHRCDAADGANDGITTFPGLPDGVYVLRQTVTPSGLVRTATQMVTAPGITDITSDHCFSWCNTVMLRAQGDNAPIVLDGCLSLPAGLLITNQFGGFRELTADEPLGCADLDGLIAFPLELGTPVWIDDTIGWRVNIRRSGVLVAGAVLLPSANSSAIQEITVPDPARFVVHAVGENGQPLPAPFDCGAPAGFARSDCVFTGVKGTEIGVGLPAAQGYVAPQGFTWTLTSMTDSTTVQWPRAEVLVTRRNSDGSPTTGRFCVAIADLSGTGNDFGCAAPSASESRVVFKVMTASTWQIDEVETPAGEPPAESVTLTLANGESAAVVLRAGNSTLSVLGVPQKYGDACAELREPGAVPDLWGEIPTVATSCDNDPATGFALGPVVARSYELFITDLPLWYAPVVVPVTLAAGANSVTVSVPDQAGMAVRLLSDPFSAVGGACWQVTDDPQGNGDVDMRRCDASDGAADGVTTFPGLADGTYILRQMTIPAGTVRVPTQDVTSPGMIEVTTYLCELCVTAWLRSSSENQPFALDACATPSAIVRVHFPSDGGHEDAEHELDHQCVDLDGAIGFGFAGGGGFGDYEVVSDVTLALTRSGISVGNQSFALGGTGYHELQVVLSDVAQLIVHAVGEDGQPLPASFDCGAPQGFPRSDCVIVGVMGTLVPVGLPAAPGYAAPRGFTWTPTSATESITVQWPRASVTVHRWIPTFGGDHHFCVLLTDTASVAPGDYGVQRRASWAAGDEGRHVHDRRARFARRPGYCRACHDHP